MNPYDYAVWWALRLYYLQYYTAIMQQQIQEMIKQNNAFCANSDKYT